VLLGIGHQLQKQSNLYPWLWQYAFKSGIKSRGRSVMGLNFLKTKNMKEWASLFRERGFKGIVKEKGWRILLLFIGVYLIRDTILYIIIPYFIIGSSCN